MPSWLLPFPWSTFSDPAWLVLANFLFWPGYFVYLVVGEWLDQRRKRRKWESLRTVRTEVDA